MTIQQQANLLVEFHGKQAAYNIARFKCLNDRKQSSRQYWKEVMEEIQK